METNRCTVCGRDLPELWPGKLCLDCAIAKLRAQYKARGKGELFEALSPRLMGDTPAYDELAKRFDTTVAALRMEVSRMRKDLRKLLKDNGNEGGLLEALSV